MSTATNDKELEQLCLTWKKCKKCPLYRNRKTAILPLGNPNPQVVFVLDRLHVGSMYGEGLENSTQIWVLNKILSYLENNPVIKDFWVTPVVLCPTKATNPKEKSPDMMPLPKVNHLTACRERLHKELHILQPKVIVACGAVSLKALHIKAPPKYKEAFGVMSEVYIQGDLVPYAVPVMTTFSVNYLDRLGQSDPGIWNKFYEHLNVSLEIADELNNLMGGRHEPN